MEVELRDLRWAIIAAQHRSLRQAADALNIRQSTLSRRLRDLEYRLGAELFERTNGGTRPTTAGQEFLETARRIVEETDAAFVRLRARCSGENGCLTIGVYTSLSTGNLRATLMEHRRRYRDVDVHMVDGPRARLLCDFSGKAIDVAIMTTCGLTWDDRTLPLWSERVIVALPDRQFVLQSSCARLPTTTQLCRDPGFQRQGHSEIVHRRRTHADIRGFASAIQFQKR